MADLELTAPPVPSSTPRPRSEESDRLLSFQSLASNENDNSNPPIAQFFHLISILFSLLLGKLRDSKEISMGKNEAILQASMFDFRSWISDISESDLRKLSGAIGNPISRLEEILGTIQYHLEAIKVRLEKPKSRLFRGAIEELSDRCGLIQDLVRDLKAFDIKQCLLESTSKRSGEITRHPFGQKPPSVLSFDGGGIKSYASLLILQKLMQYVDEEWARQDPDSDIIIKKPCDIFDFIFGTSSGGLLAIMLGRLEMTVDECIDKFVTYSTMTFESPRIRSKLLRPFNISKYDGEKIQQITRRVIGESDPSPTHEKWKRNLFATSSGRCKTGILATNATRALAPYMFRTYDCNISDDIESTLLNPGPANMCQIWEVACATTAAPTYFEPVKIDGDIFLDGGITANNPTQEALREVAHLYDNNLSDACIVSIGSGLSPDSIPSTQLGKKYSGKLGIIRMLTEILTETESTNSDVRFEEGLNLGFTHFRFNSKHDRQLPLDSDLRKERDTIYRSTQLYLELPETHEILRQCASKLVSNKYQTTNRQAAFDIEFDLSKFRRGRTNYFIGREAELDLMLGELLFGEKQHRRKICVLHGLGGIGKTQLAIEYMVRYHVNYTSCFFLDGTTELSLIQSLLQIASQLPQNQISDIDAQDSKELGKSRKIAEEVLDWFARKGNTQWLLVYDGIDEISYGDESAGKDPDTSTAYNVQDYFPKGMAGTIIITTRLRHLTSLGTGILLSGLTPDDSIRLLGKYAERSLKQANSDELDPDAIKLARRLGHLPLALVLAGSYLRKVDLAKYLKLYDQTWLELNSTMKPHPDYTRTMITTFQISYDNLARKSPNAAKLLRLCGYLNNEDFWYELFHWGSYQKEAPKWLQEITSSEVSFIETLDTLIDSSWITKNVPNISESFSIHSYVYDWIRNVINKENHEGLLQTSAITIGLAVPGSRNSPLRQRRLLPHVAPLLQYLSQIREIQDLDELFLDSIDRIGSFCFYQNSLIPAELIYKEMLQKKKEVLGPEDLSTLNTTANLGATLLAQRLFDKAETVCRQAFKDLSGLFGRNHLSTLKTVGNLGMLYRYQGDLGSAKFCYERALEGLTEGYGPEHESTCQVITNLSALYFSQDRLPEASEMYSRALERYQKTLGPEHPSTFNTLTKLSMLLEHQGNLEEAVEMAQRAFHGAEKTFGPIHQFTLTLFARLSNLFEHQGNLEEAVEMAQRAFHGAEKTFGPTHQFTLTLIARLFNLFEHQGNVASAKEMSRLLEGFEKPSESDDLGFEAFQERFLFLDVMLIEPPLLKFGE